MQITVANIAPTTALTGGAAVDEETVYTLAIDPIVDPGADTIRHYIIHYGDGQPQTVAAADLPPNREVNRTYADGSNTHTIQIDLIDEDGTDINVNLLDVTIYNVAPIALLSGAANVDEGSLYPLTIGPIVRKSAW